MASHKRKEYLNQFEKQGKQYVYTGEHYVFSGTPQERKRAYARLYTILAVLLALILGSGYLTGGGMKNSFYVILPYIGEACAFFASVWYSFKLLTKGDSVREYVYSSTIPKIPVAFAIVAFFAIAGLLCSLIYSVTSRFADGIAQGLAYLAFKAADCAVALLFRAQFSKLEWIKE